MNLHPPPTFLPVPGTPSLPWDEWYLLFETYLQACGGDSYSSERKVSILLNCLGVEGQRQYRHLPDTTSAVVSSAAPDTATSSRVDAYTTAVAKLKDRFTPSINRTAERYKFRSRAQFPDESVDAYISALTALASTCNFGSLVDEMICDQLVEKTTKKEIRDRLLLEPDLTLTSARVIARQVQQAMQGSVLLSGSSHAVGQVSTKHKATPAPRKEKCYRCGSTGHKANNPSCPAINKTCRKCLKKGHFASVCRGGTSHAKTVHQLDASVLNVTSSSASPLFCQVEVDGIPVKMLVDTGSSVSLLPYSLYKQHFKHLSLRRANIELKTYSQQPIPVHGVFSAQVGFASRSEAGSFYVVRTGQPILGIDILHALDIKLEIAHQRCLRVSDSGGRTDRSYSEMFPSLFSDGLGLVKGFTHKVTVKTSVPPLQQKLRRLPLEVRQKVSEELHKLEQQDIIERIDASEWVSPIVVVWKKTGDIRLCVDLRRPNEAVVVDSHPLPHQDDLFQRLAGAYLYSKLDLSSAYHQLLLDEESRNLTAFITHDGLYRYKRVCFGLASAAAAFQKMLSTVLKDCTGVVHYLDDILVFGKTQEDHDRNLIRVLQRLEAAGVRLNSKKCTFSAQEIQFLGHTLSDGTLRPSQDTLAAILQAPCPQNVTELRSFLGLASYYLKFVPHFSTVVEPLRRLLREGVQFTWGPEQQKAFETIKFLIKDCVPLVLFDTSLPTFVTTDASGCGLGAVLQQLHPEGLRTVCFASRTLSPAERAYSTGEKEALACLWACEKWHTYLFGRRFVLRTDHQALVTLLSTQGYGRQPMRIARWAARLLQYNYEVQYTKGEDNKVADALSRLPLNTQEDSTTSFDEESELVCYIQQLQFSPLSASDIQEATSADLVLGKLLRVIGRTWRPSSLKQDPDLAPYYCVLQELSTVQDILVRGDRVIPPTALRKRIIDLGHEGHPGIVRTKQRVRSRYWWPNMDREIEHYVRACPTCNITDKTAVTHPTPLQPISFPSGPWKQIGIDVVGPFNNFPSQSRYAITVVDYFSKWPEVKLAPNATTDTIINFLRQLFSREGYCDVIISDHGPQFQSHAFRSFLQERGIEHRQSSIYHPQSNGQVERFNRVLKDLLQSISAEKKDILESLPEFLGIYRSTPHAATQMTPAELLHGRKLRTRLDIIGFPSLDGDIIQELSKLREKVRKYQERSKRYFDTRHSVKEPNFEGGDFVRIRLPGIQAKGTSSFSPPTRVDSQVGSGGYKMDDGRTWNAARLARVALPTPESADPIVPAAPPAPPQRPQRNRHPPRRYPL